MKEDHLNLEGFSRLMTSPEMHIFKQKHAQVYQDMNLPMNNYFISSSHNTYLTGDQLVGKSQLCAYASALLAGCRCVEIDCWDGPGNEPIVTHGGTLTSKISFKDVLFMIKTCAFVKSPYPLILSLDNHCSAIQKDVMANNLITILGDLLLTEPIGEQEDSLPSPEKLKNKILIKDKVYYKDNVDSGSSPSEGSEEDENMDDNKDNMQDKYSSQRKRKMVKSKSQRISRIFSKVSKRSKAVALSEYVIYLKATKFYYFEHSKLTQKFDHSTSLAEVKAKNLADYSAPDFIAHTNSFFTRIYPKGTRVDSSNYNPQTFWNVGCQMVSLNFQTDGLAMDLQRGKFKTNGSCGYLLKPESLRKPEANFNPNAPPCDFDPIILSIMIICGNQLILSDESIKGDKLDPFVTVEVHGIPIDEAKQQTSIVKNNAFNPEWNQPLNFTIHAPELALVRFCVESQKTISVNEFIGQNTLALTSMNKGYRSVPLFKKNGDALRSSTLFVHVQYGSQNAICS
ncbi:1-phosphatidylinositol 4,5-bisphosphate phosphodiesterase zeta-1 [Pleurodeles waltl]|uniref:1-phosphatidylinositol 4,5-bisphosphate phosphodiesterase zeta-1 n=1 Tax=Pleurodeles waltl TaxID=8319 RepID=UPI0037099A2B